MKKKKQINLIDKLCDKAEKHSMTLAFGSLGKGGIAILTLEARKKGYEKPLQRLNSFLINVMKKGKWNILGVTSELTDSGYRLYRINLLRVKK